MGEGEGNLLFQGIELLRSGCKIQNDGRLCYWFRVADSPAAVAANVFLYGLHHMFVKYIQFPIPQCNWTSSAELHLAMQPYKRKATANPERNNII